MENSPATEPEAVVLEHADTAKGQDAAEEPAPDTAHEAETGWGSLAASVLTLGAGVLAVFAVFGLASR